MGEYKQQKSEGSRSWNGSKWGTCAQWLPAQASARGSTPTRKSSNQNLSWRFITYSKYHTVVICPNHQVDKTNRSLIRMHTKKLIFLIRIKLIHHYVAASPGSNLRILCIQIARHYHINHKKEKRKITAQLSVVFPQPLTPKCQWSPIASYPFIQLNTVESYHKLMKSRPNGPNSVSLPRF